MAAGFNFPYPFSKEVRGFCSRTEFVLGILSNTVVNRKRKQQTTTYTNLEFTLERVSVECHKTQIKVITLVNQKGRKQSSKQIKIRSHYL